MTNATAIRERFLRDLPPRRIGNVAANLARMSTFAAETEHSDLVCHLAEESALFIDWAAPDAEPEIQCEFLTLQRLLVSWTRSWKGIWENPQEREHMRKDAAEWSQRLLRLAGLTQ